MLDALSKGQEYAFTEVYNRYYKNLYYLSSHLVGDHAPDIIADVFTELWIQKKHFDSGEHLLAYLRVMVRNACFHFLKRQERDHQLHREFLYRSDLQQEDYYFREIIEARVFSMLRAEMDELPPHLREVFILAYKGGLKNTEIARLLHIKESSVRVRKVEALKLLRTAFYRIELFFLLQQLFLSKL